MEQSIDQAVAALVQALYESEIGLVRSVHVDVQDSGEHPYRVVVADAELPLPGLATTQPRS